MKRMSNANDIDYDTALKKVNLVERNVIPCGVNLVNKYRSAIHETDDIIQLATQIQRANDSIKQHTSGKLGIILEQIKMLQMQAKTILTEMDRNNDLNHTPCNFMKKPGQVYHLYQKTSGARYFSLLSEEEWNGSCKDAYLGSFRYENDLSWTPINEIRIKDNALTFSNKVVDSYLSCKDKSFLAIASSEMDIDQN